MKKENTFEDDDLQNELEIDDNNFLNNNDDIYEADIYDEDEDLLDDINSKKSLEEELKEEKQKRKKEFYVKGADLKAEIQKYHDSKKNSPNRKTELYLKN